MQGGGADRGKWVKESRGEGGDWGGGHTDSVMRHGGGGGESESGGGDWGRGQAEGDGGGGQELSLLPLLPDHPPPPALLLPVALPVDHLATIPSHPDHVTQALAWEGFVSQCDRGQAEDRGEQHLQYQQLAKIHFTSTDRGHYQLHGVIVCGGSRGCWCWWWRGPHYIDALPGHCPPIYDHWCPLLTTEHRGPVTRHQ